MRHKHTCSRCRGAEKEKATGSAQRRVMRMNSRKAPTCRED